MSDTHAAHAGQASQAAARRLFPPTPRSWFLASFVTTITLPHYLLQSISTTVHGTVLCSEGTSFREYAFQAHRSVEPGSASQP